MDSSTTVARLATDEPTARGLAGTLAEHLDPDDCACAAFAGDGGRWWVEIYFRAPPDQGAVRALVARAAGEEAAEALRFETVEAADWVAASLAGLTPVEAGRFIVHGAHDRRHVAASRIGIEIEAGLAFGTGHHGTTRGCLLALNALSKQRRQIPGPPRYRGRDKKNVLDVGTGSGVLAIAAAKALHCPVTAIDIDAQAVATARANGRLNGAAQIAFARANGPRGQIVGGHAPYDLIFANILLPPLKAMAVDLARLAAPGGVIVLSGLLKSQANAALAVYGAQRLRLQRGIQLEGWVTLILRKMKSAPARRPRRIR